MSREKRPGIGDLLLPGLNPGIAAVTGESDEIAREAARLKRRFERGKKQLQEQITARNVQGIEQAEEELIEVATSFLDLHRSGQWRLPREDSEFLYSVLSDALLGHPLACLTRKIGGPPRSPGVTGAQWWAAGCIKETRSGRINIRDPIKTVVKLYGVTDWTVRRWMRKFPNVVGHTLDRQPPNVDPTTFAMTKLSEYAALYRAALYRAARAKPGRAAGGARTARARAAATTIHREMLLADIKAIFADRNNPDWIATSELLKGLAEMSERPWAGANGGKSITAQSLWALPRPFNVHSRRRRVGGDKRYGYAREAFVDA